MNISSINGKVKVNATVSTTAVIVIVIIAVGWFIFTSANMMPTPGCNGLSQNTAFLKLLQVPFWVDISSFTCLTKQKWLINNWSLFGLATVRLEAVSYGAIWPATVGDTPELGASNGTRTV